MDREFVPATGAARRRSFSTAVVIEKREYKTLYLRGVVNEDENGTPVWDSFESATRATFDRLRDTVTAAGGSLGDIVTMTVFITDPRWGDEFVKIRSEYFDAGRYPASALITASGLGRPQLMVEIQSIAVVAK